MRFQRLHIPAFGPFTNLELSFPSTDHDFHVIYGENEAGKSSLLRAIRDLLFGIHGQSPDNFLHDYKNLRLLGEIVNRSGEKLVVQRRKGNKNTLLDKDDNSLPDTALRPFLGSVDQAYFSAMFGLGNTELREGAQQLLRGEGDVGSALFSASLGGTPIQRVLDSLIGESERIFKGRATANVSVRPAVNKYKDLLKQSRDSMINPELWDKLEKELADQELVKKRLDSEISELDRNIAWISRCEDALPSVGRLGEEMRLVQDLPELPELASDFVERAQSSRNSVNQAKAKVQTLTTHVAQLEQQLKDCPASPELLNEAEALDALHQNLGAYRTRKESLTNLKSALAGIEPVLRAGMTSLELSGELESLETLRLSSAVRLGCEETAKAMREAMSKRVESGAKAEELKQKIESLKKELNSIPGTDLTPLREALAVAASATEAYKTLTLSESEIEDLTREMIDRHSLVHGAPKDFDATAALSVPATSTIREFRDQFDRIQRNIQTEDECIDENGKRVESLQAELSRLERRGELPSEEALQKARVHRDHGWSLVLAEWKGDGAKEELVPGSPLDEAFPQSIAKADDIADQLRQQAEAVAQAEEKRFQINKSEKLIEETKRKLTELRSSLKECQNSWETEWADCDITPRSSGEMEEWREAWLEFRDTLRRLRTAEAAVKVKIDQIKHAKKDLAVVLRDSQEKDFLVLFEAARSRVQTGEELTGRKKLIAEQLQTHTNQLEIFEQNSATLIKTINAATTNWKSQCQAVGLHTDTSPDSGLNLLEERKKLLTTFDRWKELEGESRKTADAVLQYEQTVKEKALTLNVQGDTTEGQEAGLWKALTLSRKVQAQHEQLVEQIDRAKNDLKTAQQAENQALETLEELMRLAKLNSLDELEPLLANLEKRLSVQSRIDNFRETLGGLARGQSVDEFVARVQEENAEELPQRKVQLETDKSEKKSALQTIQSTLSTLKKQKQDLETAGDEAADLRQRAESVAATLKQDASRFMRLRLAAHFLRTQIERFREENQGPLLEKSGQVFKRITRRAFDNLGAEFNDQDQPVLVGRRADGSNVPVEGMSDGSRDQLYLALRLAALDRYLEEHEPMPLILDDLLITFDDERAKAILPQLAGLAKRTQIFLFTHHEHLVELCQQTLGKNQFNLHRLTGPAFASED